MQHDFEKTAAAMVSGTQRAITAAVAPLLARIEALEKRRPEKGERGDPGQAGERGETGVGVAGALIDRSGVLILTLSDGTTRDLGPVVGKDGTNGVNGAPGEPGRDGVDGKDGEKGLDGADGKDGVNGLNGADGKDGEPGKDGADGFGFDDLAVEHDGERGFKFRFEKGDRVKEFPFQMPVVLDRGVWREGATYHKGDGVTWAGSFWIAQKETTAKPDSGDGFRLAVKKGRDAKDRPA